MTTLPDKELLRPDEVAEYLGVSVRTVYNWRDTGKLAGKNLGHGHKCLRIYRESVILLIELDKEE